MFQENSFKQQSPQAFTIGVGLTDRCSANCPQCYSRPDGANSELDFDRLLQLLDQVPIASVNFGTGESILYPRFKELIQNLAARRIKMAVTTNGSTVHNLSDNELRLFHDIDFSLDFPGAAMNDDWRGIGSFEFVMEGVRRCGDLGVEASLVTCLMKENARYMGAMADLALTLGLNLRVNVYKPVNGRELMPGYDQFWQAIGDLCDAAYFIACSEPIVNAALGRRQGVKGSPCGQHSFRIHPDESIVACVYLQSRTNSVADLIADFKGSWRRAGQELELSLPEICRTCAQVEICAGGCTARRRLGQSSQPDEFCFMVRGGAPTIKARWKAGKDLVHENYLCTMIFSG